METVNKAAMIPSKKEYSGEKFKLSKEALQKTIDEVEKMNATEVSQKLDQYKDIIPGKTNDNTFEMMALYQKALTLLGTKTKIDSRFGTETHTNLKTVQAEKLKFTGTNTDGLPGPKTTKALIAELGKTQSTEPVVPVAPVAAPKPIAPVAPAASAASAASAPIVPVVTPKPTAPVAPAASAPELTAKELADKQKLVTIEDYLLNKEGFIKNTDGTYRNTEDDLTLSIKDGKVEYTRKLSRIFSWGLNTTEQRIVAEVENLLHK